MKVFYPFFILCLLWQGVQAQNKPVQAYQLIKSNNAVQYKNYYLLTLFQQLPELNKMLQTNSRLKLGNGVVSHRVSAVAELFRANHDGCIDATHGPAERRATAASLTSRVSPDQFSRPSLLAAHQ